MHLSSRSNRFHGYAPGLLTAHPTLASAATDSPAGQSDGLWSILQFAWERCEAFGLQRIGTYLLIAATLSLLLLWPVARMIAGPKRILTETTLFVGSTIVLSAAFLALGYFILRSGSMVALALLPVVYAAILFGQTRHIFETSRGAAAGILGSYLAVAAVALYATEFITGHMPWTEFLFKTREERNQAFEEWRAGKDAKAPVAPAVATPASGLAASPAANPAATPASAVNVTVATAPVAPPIPSRGGVDLQALYVQLQKARAELNMSDPVAVARFNEQAAAYNQEKAIAAALSAPRPAPAKVAQADSAGQAMAGGNSPGGKVSKK